MDHVEQPFSNVTALIAAHGLKRLPVEATLYRSTWVSTGTHADGTPHGTAIVGLYTVAGAGPEEPPSRSLFHRLSSDEVWHFYGGDPLRLVLLHPDGADSDVVLGPDWAQGHLQQFVIRAGTWQAGEVLPGGRYSLFGCTMAPGFTGSSFTGGRMSELLVEYPQRCTDIERLSVPDAEAVDLPSGFTQ